MPERSFFAKIFVPSKLGLCSMLYSFKNSLLSSNYFLYFKKEAHIPFCFEGTGGPTQALSMLGKYTFTELSLTS